MSILDEDEDLFDNESVINNDWLLTIREYTPDPAIFVIKCGRTALCTRCIGYKYNIGRNGCPVCNYNVTRIVGPGMNVCTRCRSTIISCGFSDVRAVGVPHDLVKVDEDTI